MPPFSGVIAIDGPAGTGKSTIARGVARRLGLRYLDTGAMYRAAAVAVLRAGVDPSDADAVTAVVDGARIEIGTDATAEYVLLDGDHVERDIRGPAATVAVSPVSAVPAVRERLVAAQRAVIDAGRIVVEGRDIGSVVAPGARPKIFLTAASAERARRRSRQEGVSDVDTVGADLDRRDRYDSARAASPLRKAEDAIEVDTTDLTVEQVLDHVLDLIAAVGANSHSDSAAHR